MSMSSFLLQADCYIKRIRIERKREYANAYLSEIRWGREVDEKIFTDLSYMVKQGVRMQLDELYLNN